ncbi:Proteasome assembly chaperone 2 [Perkinsus olseni]|uniref:Proteasome assembly chaperone 2 n=3 Tax=Perkinsus olseni TaxID=32597 RepID=A0A7J6U2X8_PEROL|nr:Proteasome assembly chaperone 2 [Perkinsus olseni]
MQDTQREVLLPVDAEPFDDLTFWPLDEGVRDLEGKTLIVSCGSFASIEGLACDYLIETLKLAPAGVFTSPFIEPLVQTLDDGKSISTGMELYGKEGTDYMVLQLRSSYRRKRLLGQALSRWIAKSGFSKVLAVSSMSSHVQDDSDLEVNTPLRVFRSAETFGLPTIDKERIVGGGLITRLDDDIPGLLCFAKGTDVEKLPLARIVAEFLMTNVCNFPQAPTDVEPASWRAIRESSGYGRYDDEDDLRRIMYGIRLISNSLSADGSGRDGNLFLDQGFRGGKLNNHNTVPHVACPSGGTSADGHINSTSLVMGRANSDEVWNFSSTRPNEAFVHFGGRSKSDGSKVAAEASCRVGRELAEASISSSARKEQTGGFDCDPSKLGEMLPWSASIDMRSGQWKGVDRSEDPPFSRRVGLLAAAAAGPKPSEEVANVPEAEPPNDGASTPGRPAVFERHGFIFDEYKRHQYHGYARNNHGGLWKCESHTGPG